MKSVKKLESVKTQVAQLNGKAIVGGDGTITTTTTTTTINNSMSKLSSGLR